MAWQQRMANLPGPLAAASINYFDDEGHLNIRMELLISGLWTDITSAIRAPDGTVGITINRGTTDENSRPSPSTMTVSLNNRDGVFSNKNPRSPYFGLLGRNTQCRIWVGDSLRFWGEVAEFPQRWDSTGTDVWTPLEAAGILRRLSQGKKPLGTVMFRGVTDPAYNGILLDYWSCTEGKNATVVNPNTSGSAPLTVTGTVNLADYSNFNTSDPVMTLADGAMVTATFRSYTSTEFICTVLSKIPDSITNGDVIYRFFCSGTAARWDVVWSTGGGLTVKQYDSVGALAFTGSTWVAQLDIGVEYFMRFGLIKNGTGVDFTMIWVPGSPTLRHVGNTFGTTDTSPGVTVTAVRRLVIAPNGDQEGMPIGHIAAANANTFITFFVVGALAVARENELSDVRIFRLSTERGVSTKFASSTAQEDTVTLGAQLNKSYLDLIYECVDTGLGILTESRSEFGLKYLQLPTLYNQESVSLDYASAHFSGQFLPTEDDRYIRNDVTINQIDGSSAQYTITEGPLSTQDPPDGVGQYDIGPQMSIFSSGDIIKIAQSLANAGTIDELRYPELSVNLARAPFRQDGALTANVVGLNIGRVIEVENLPDWLPPDGVQEIIRGYTETITGFEWKFSFNLAPYLIYRVLVLDDDTYGRLDDDNVALEADLDSTDTTFNLTVSAFAPMSTSADTFDVLLGGERMTITAVGDVSPGLQAVTAIRSVNGIVKEHSAGDPVHLLRPSVMAL